VSADARATSRVASSREWIRTRDLCLNLIVRDIKLRYRGSLLGVLWTLINPLAELLVLLFVFGHVLRVDVPNFSSYLFIGLTAYNWFQSSLNFATGAIVANRDLVRRPGVPVMILPVITVASNMVHFVLSMPILAGLLIASGIALTPAVLWLPVLVVIEFALILAFAYPISIVHVWFRDTQHLLRVALQLLFYLTPVFYSVSIATIPERLRLLYQLNPMMQMIDAYRRVLMYGTAPRAAGLAYISVLALVLLTLGMVWFHRASQRFADEV
jgi:lipopolysaccharide transport system permease protein